jgi:hypothetical protein
MIEGKEYVFQAMNARLYIDGQSNRLVLQLVKIE